MHSGSRNNGMESASPSQVMRAEEIFGSGVMLYFGGSRPKGSVSELEWQLFLRDEVTLRFPNGMTVWDAEGQWRGLEGKIGHERTKVLLLVHPDTEQARQGIRAVIDRYRKAFEQESVLWETSQVCAAL
jgi:hypothetical protein